MNSKYGVFETICDELVGKTFGDINTTIRAGLNEKYFETFFDRFDEKEIMTILGNLGQVFQSTRLMLDPTRTLPAWICNSQDLSG